MAPARTGSSRLAEFPVRFCVFTSPSKKKLASLPQVHEEGGGASRSVGDHCKSVLSRDRQLLKEWQEGRRETGLELILNYHGLFYSLCRRLGIKTADDQEDLYQQMVLEILMVLPKLQIERSFGGYLRKLVLSLVLRRRDKPPLVPLASDVRAPRRDSPADKAHGQELMDAILYCQGRLEEKEAEVFEGIIHERKTCLQLTSELELTPGNLYVILHRARTKVKECLKEKGFALDA